MAKRPISSEELYYDDSDDCVYELRPDGSYERVRTAGLQHITDLGQITSDQGADVSVSTTALSGGTGAQALPAGTVAVRFQLKAVAGANNWVAVKFGTSAVAVTSSTGTVLMAGEGPMQVPVPAGADHFDAIAGAALTLNWTPA